VAVVAAEVAEQGAPQAPGARLELLVPLETALVPERLRPVRQARVPQPAWLQLAAAPEAPAAQDLPAGLTARSARLAQLLARLLPEAR